MQFELLSTEFGQLRDQIMENHFYVEIYLFVIIGILLLCPLLFWAIQFYI